METIQKKRILQTLVVNCFECNEGIGFKLIFSKCSLLSTLGIHVTFNTECLVIANHKK